MIDLFESLLFRPEIRRKKDDERRSFDGRRLIHGLPDQLDYFLGKCHIVRPPNWNVMFLRLASQVLSNSFFIMRSGEKDTKRRKKIIFKFCVNSAWTEGNYNEAPASEVSIYGKVLNKSELKAARFFLSLELSPFSSDSVAFVLFQQTYFMKNTPERYVTLGIVNYLELPFGSRHQHVSAQKKSNNKNVKLLTIVFFHKHRCKLRDMSRSSRRQKNRTSGKQKNCFRHILRTSLVGKKKTSLTNSVDFLRLHRKTCHTGCSSNCVKRIVSSKLRNQCVTNA